MAKVWLGMGSNLGDKQAHLRAALEQLARCTRLVRISSLYRTEPVGYLEQDWFLNAAVELETSLSPLDLLATIQRIETRLGRLRLRPNGPRSIDLDILLWDELVFESPTLVIPHPRMHERHFVLAPLAEIAPERVHPRLRRTVAQLQAMLTPRTGVEPFPDPNWPLTRPTGRAS